MASQDERVFFEYLKGNKELVLINYELQNGDVWKIKSYEEINSYKFFIVHQNSRINFSGEFISVDSDIIEFVRSASNITKKLDRGRLWIQTNYWFNGTSYNQLDLLIKEYEKLVRWIKKNYKKSIDGFWYIGPETYQMYQNKWDMVVGPRDKAEF
jgi:hypothetical protein